MKTLRAIKAIILGLVVCLLVACPPKEPQWKKFTTRGTATPKTNPNGVCGANGFLYGFDQDDAKEKRPITIIINNQGECPITVETRQQADGAGSGTARFKVAPGTSGSKTIVITDHKTPPWWWVCGTPPQEKPCKGTIELYREVNELGRVEDCPIFETLEPMMRLDCKGFDTVIVHENATDNPQKIEVKATNLGNCPFEVWQKGVTPALVTAKKGGGEVTTATPITVAKSSTVEFQAGCKDASDENGVCKGTVKILIKP
jgi:hypothetical protein